MGQEELPDRRQEALPNRKMFGWLSVEQLIWAGCTLVALAVSYSTLAERVDVLKANNVKDKAKLEKVQEDVSAMRTKVQEDVSAIRTDVEVIKTLQEANQRQSEKQFEEISRKNAATERKLDEILGRLPERR